MIRFSGGVRGGIAEAVLLLCCVGVDAQDATNIVTKISPNLAKWVIWLPFNVGHHVDEKKPVFLVHKDRSQTANKVNKNRNITVVQGLLWFVFGKIVQYS